ncbi:Transcriptional regulator, TetR family [Pseudonocardia sp. Ae168_Ps1]|uniref:TetR/AcrR family transcriptional regulator n=1 Tax=unclassified Pseudonocardia TaxID=2619320 RepID=UPI00094B5538|nr:MULTISPECIES: TetR/AcrR family transcriptional regulator [unclassified Pseudonocardia]OLL75925.1 Transcriptional regulator, TetR family [Pseudonocardia sp. Ae150A_Ps1]OLL81924.1 Transcriptional regulator, TetR family [Pseudonocardia sp. Ae168_Ps1]OLL83963.1 Transcriptional regulator, TetR family [Pseudonocardia sp. Ae263_Ps1]OLL96017.1 Transcriptional regulator, TetR family [Pseudonocardia sp. Ae356_Ps1]
MARGSSDRPSEPRSRLLGTASRIFYAEGVHSVGVDRILTEAGTTRATFYRHFPGKEDLVVAYLEAADQQLRARFEQSRADRGTAEDVLRAVAADIAGDIGSPGFRGCAFLNAAAEYPDPSHPVHRRIVAHREWFLGAVSELFAEVGDGLAEPAGRHFAMLRDGAMAAGCLSDPATVGRTFLDGVEGLLWSRSVPGAPRG